MGRAKIFNRRTGRGFGLAALVVSIAVMGLAASSASARTFKPRLLGDPVPNGCGGPANCSLREAVIDANARPGFDSIVLRPGTLYRLAIASTDEDLAADGDIDVTDPLSISTPKFRRTPQGRRRARPARVSGEGISRIFDVHDPLTLRRLVLREGHAQGAENDGGAVSVGDVSDTSALRAFSVRFLSNRADDFGGAATFYDGPSVLFVRSVFRNNVADDDSGAVDIAPADTPADHRATFRRVRASNNTAGTNGEGGVSYIDNTTATFVRSRLNDNRAGAEGGAIYNTGGVVTVLRSTIANNTTQNFGGGIAADAETTTVRNSTISGNRAVAESGGIDVTNADLTVVNSTIANNRTDEDGGGVGSYGSANVSLNAVTVARNRANADASGADTGGGLFQSGASTFTVANSLIALNSVGGGGADPSCSGTFTSSFNLFTSNDAGCTRAPGTGDLIRANPRIGRLSNNGGPTRTIPLRRGSPAINKAGATAPNRDQRGVRKFRRRDIGAFERRPRR